MEEEKKARKKAREGLTKPLDVANVKIKAEGSSNSNAVSSASSVSNLFEKLGKS